MPTQSIGILINRDLKKILNVIKFYIKIQEKYMKVTIISSPTCQYCVMAKKYAEENGITGSNLDYRVIGKDIQMDEAVSLVGQPFRTVPQILIDGVLVGGYNDFVKHVNKKNFDSKDFDDMTI